MIAILAPSFDVSPVRCLAVETPAGAAAGARLPINTIGGRKRSLRAFPRADRVYA
jgi:beta-phosphoglucomutase-like phosphatase (HAD superfamily)